MQDVSNNDRLLKIIADVWESSFIIDRVESWELAH
jgi:hypothetical protein